MATRLPPSSASIGIEPEDRIVVLARTLHARSAEREPTGEGSAAHGTGFGETFLGRALYRHRSIFRGASDAPIWSHLELSYFRAVVPADVIHDLVFKRDTAEARLLRAEILLTTPSAFVMPRDRRGSADRHRRQVSIEYIDVEPAHFDDYREVMRRYIGPAATKVAAEGKIGMFEAMETAAVLFQDRSHTVDWNQIHVCELDTEGFRGFGQEFDAALREISPDGASSRVFAGLDRMRSIPRWTFNDAVVEADLTSGR